MLKKSCRLAPAISLLFAPCMVTGCDSLFDRYDHQAVAPRVQEWDIGGQLAARKQVVVQTCRDAKRSDETIALLLAVIMGETQSCSACDRDMSKDGSGDARNVSAYNLNIYMLKDIGFDVSKVEELNDDAHLDEATRAALMGIDKYGEEKFLWGHRGGQAAMEDGVSYGAREFVAHIRSVQSYLLQHPEHFSDGVRLGDFVQHV